MYRELLPGDAEPGVRGDLTADCQAGLTDTESAGRWDCLVVRRLSLSVTCAVRRLAACRWGRGQALTGCWPGRSIGRAGTVAGEGASCLAAGAYAVSGSEWRRSAHRPRWRTGSVNGFVNARCGTW